MYTITVQLALCLVEQTTDENVLPSSARSQNARLVNGERTTDRNEWTQTIIISLNNGINL